ncbi:DUF4274 domain-containing protein [Chryseobacterium formosus]|uniref:DUF4274 domain-containing protein n=1 Tax=Chryseobacterium formosus TaxID=1537363 RepID=A0ABT3XX91_9FLAO|nr:DUF4274 domain-containing protein [Chryseobacterium formosus]MCX8526270.1 DUF4274 domain-containing protein [Chryseobacterium formosus]
MDSHNFTRAEKLFVSTELYNWDNGNNRLYETLNSEHCDKATALMIYWRADPNFYYSRYNSETDVPEGWQLNGYKLMKKAEKLLLENNFPETISYTPDEDRIPKDRSVLKKIPSQLLQPTQGINSSLIVKNYIEAEYLIDACGTKGDLEEVKRRLERNPDILNLCINGFNPLIKAVSHWKNKNLISLVTFLLEKGADVDVQPSGHPKESILFKCSSCKNIELITLLVQYGAELNAVNQKGDTVLHEQLASTHEFWRKYSSAKFLKTLLNMGADLNHKNADGKTPIDLAKENNNESALKVIEKFLK